MKFRNVSTEVEENVEVDNKFIDDVISQYYNAIDEADYEYKEETKKSRANGGIGPWDSSIFKKLENVASKNILPPSKIELITQVLVQNYKKEKSDKMIINKNFHDVVGKFISSLISESYKAGHNNFKINTKELFYIPYYINNLKASKKRPFNLETTGNVTKDKLRDYSAPYYFNWTINGHLGYWMGAGAMHSTITLDGTLRQYYDKKTYDPSLDCIFRTTNKDAYDELVKKVSGKKNKVQLIDEDGEIIKSKRVWRRWLEHEQQISWLIKEDRKINLKRAYSTIKGYFRK